jgi:hypothetical protein
MQAGRPYMTQFDASIDLKLNPELKFGLKAKTR